MPGHTSFKPAPPPLDSPAPYLWLELDASGTRIAVPKLLKEISAFTGRQATQDIGGWAAFASKNGLVYPAAKLEPIIPSPTWWVADTERWFAIAISAAGDQAHIYFGWTLPNGQQRRHTHIDLAKDSRRWLNRVRRGAKSWRQNLGGYAATTGTLFFGGDNTHIGLRPRKSLWKTLTQNDTVAAVLSIVVAAGSGIMRIGEFPVPAVGIQVGAAGAVSLGYVAAKHFFLTPSLSWEVEGLD